MKKTLFIALTTLTACATASSALADNLVQVYQQASTSDPTFKKAHSDWKSLEQNLPIAQSALHPFIDISASLMPTYAWKTNHNPLAGQPEDTQGLAFSDANNSVQVNLSQKIFDDQDWKLVDSAKFSVKAATAQYLAAGQDLIARTAAAYFNVLNASEQLQYVVAEKNAELQELHTEEQKYQVGLVASTDLYDARAKYDNSVAQEIKSRQELQDQLENLSAITGKHYTSLASLKKDIPLVMPTPKNINAWVNIAQKHNYAIQAAYNNMLAAGEDVKAAAAGRYPTVSLNAQAQAKFNGLTNPIPPQHDGFIQDHTQQVSAGLTVNFPVYQGGSISATTQQKEYDYVSAINQLDLTRRTVITDTREDYLGINSDIMQIKADEAAIASAKQQLTATKASYDVGTRTMVDVLQAMSTLFESEETWAKDRYSYIENLINLKKDAGTLSPDDLAKINDWLSKPVAFNLSTPIKIEPPENITALAPSTNTPTPGANNTSTPATVVPPTDQTKAKATSAVNSTAPAAPATPAPDKKPQQSDTHISS